MSKSDDLFADLPVALAPVYQTPQANVKIPLYEGLLKLHHAGHVLSGPGTVQMAWLPTPRVSFDMLMDNPAEIDLLDDESKLELVDQYPSELIDAKVRSAELFIGQESQPASGVIQAWERGSETPLQSLIFHVPNFPSYRGQVIREGKGARCGRAAATFGEWRIVLDELAAKASAKDLKGTGGFAITHVGSLERSDGGPFSRADAAIPLDGLYWFLSFCSARSTGPVLLVGHDKDGAVFHEWTLPRLAPYGDVRCWFSEHGDDVASQVYPGFAQRWSDDVWTLAVKSTIYWYLIANAPGGSVENGVILTHVAFDTLCWTLFVEDVKSLTPTKYDRLAAAEKLRLLLTHCGIALQVPAELPGLEAAAKAERWADGPAALACVRNAYVHPTLKNRERLTRAGDEAQYQAWVLGMHYLELILLNLFNYQGEFSNRLIGGCYKGGEVRRVPWAS